MDIYAPKYYKKFKCIADKCLNSCCIGWEIDIDESSYKKYLSLSEDRKNAVLSTVELDGDIAHFTLDCNGRCKNLDERGLCKIITSLGEEYLCDICRLHPRFINDLGTHTEIGLGLSCEEAARIILAETEPFELVKIDENDDPCDGDPAYPEAVKIRNNIIGSVEKRSESFFLSLSEIEKKHGVELTGANLEEWVELLLSYEILNEEWENILENALGKEPKCDLTPFGEYFKALFKYLVYRHVATAESELDLKARIALAALLTKIVAYLAERENNLTEHRLSELVRLMSSEIEYSEENTESLILELETELM